MNANGRWDCIYTIPRPGGGLYGYWTATPKAETGGRFGFGETLDGVTLEGPSATAESTVLAAERPARSRRSASKFYMMFGTGGIMVTLVADRARRGRSTRRRKTSVCCPATRTSHGSSRRRTASWSTIIRLPPPVYFAPLKSTVVDEEGTLRLGWWKGNEKLKHAPIAVQPPSEGERPRSSVAMLQNIFDVDKGIILEGTVVLPPSQDSDRKGLYVECDSGGGVGILLASDGAAELGTIQADGSGFKAIKGVNREMEFGKSARFRLLLKYSLIEFYLDDILIECFSLPEQPTGRIGSIGDVSDLRAWRAE